MKGDRDRAFLAVTPPSVNNGGGGGGGAHPAQGLSWDAMFATCKHKTENGLACNDSDISWMSEQWRRKEKLDSVGVAWFLTCNSKPAGGRESSNQVGILTGSLGCVSSIFVLTVGCALLLLRMIRIPWRSSHNRTV
jgi:hypothetical protein